MTPNIVKCPFNSNHVMLEDSLQRHIVRCAKNYPHWVLCPYNAMHRFPNKEVLIKHMVACASRDNAFKFKQDYDMSGRGNDWKDVPTHIDHGKEINFAEEDWDKEYQ
ncbi:gametocyte-specific factor 1 homolog [Sitophilus oryzae]|uniref:Gametocyte-specific factor 1 homolog n=1 Tax=Sitophilus oryzae TaxID=7048 RepID=A0A6J2Y4T3_SITOR|nr:gametocyte-specific factor 1 homolog [Sitophilus oryzae]